MHHGDQRCAAYCVPPGAEAASGKKIVLRLRISRFRMPHLRRLALTVARYSARVALSSAQGVTGLHRILGVPGDSARRNRRDRPH